MQPFMAISNQEHCNKESLLAGDGRLPAGETPEETVDHSVATVWTSRTHTVIPPHPLYYTGPVLPKPS